MDKKGLAVKALVIAIISIAVVVIVWQIVPYIGQFASFFGLNLTRTDKVEGIAYLRYDLIKQDVRYYDGIEWKDFKDTKKVKLNDKEIVYEEVLKDFWNYLAGFVGLEFLDVYGNYFTIDESTLNYLRVSGRENTFFAKFFYNGEIESGSKKSEEGEFINVFKEELRREKIQDCPSFSLFYKVVISEIEDEYKYSNVIDILKELDGDGLCARADLERRDFYNLDSRFTYNKDYSFKFANLIGGKYQLYYQENPLNVYIKVESGDNGFKPVGIVLDSELIEFSKLQESKEYYLSVKESALKEIFSRTIKIKDKFYCLDFKDNKYLVVDLSEEVEEEKKCLL